MNKKGIGTIMSGILLLLVVLALGWLYFDYTLEKGGSNEDKVEFCKDLGYEVENEVNFFFSMTCFKIEDGIKTSYIVRESTTKIGETYDEHRYYLKEIGW